MTTEATPVAMEVWENALKASYANEARQNHQAAAAVIATALADMQRRVEELEAENAALRRVIHVSKGPSPENVEIIQSAFDRGWSIPLDPPEWPEMLAQAQEFLAARKSLSDKTQEKNDG